MKNTSTAIDYNKNADTARNVKKMRIHFEDGHVIENGSYSDIYERLGGEVKAITAILSQKVKIEFYE